MNEDSTQEIAEHNANVREVLDEESSPITSDELAASVEWVWQPGVGLVKVCSRRNV